MGNVHTCRYKFYNTSLPPLWKKSCHYHMQMPHSLIVMNCFAAQQFKTAETSSEWLVYGLLVALVRNCHANMKSRSFCCDHRRPHSKDSALAKYAELARSGHPEVVARHIFHSRPQGTICSEIG